MTATSLNSSASRSSNVLAELGPLLLPPPEANGDLDLVPFVEEVQGLRRVMSKS